MARKLISGNDILDFNPSTGVINLKGYVPLDKLLLINNTTRNINLFNFTDPGLPATATYNSANNTTSIDVSYDASAMSASDVIQVYYEKDELEIKPTATYKDPVSKFRVSNPQTLIDTDFEYSPQPTKWESVKLVNNVPTSYSSPFTENSILVDSITVSEGSNIMEITTSSDTTVIKGGVVDITGLTDPQFEGTFIVSSSPDNRNFSVKLPFSSPKSAILNTIYSIVYKGAFYTGSLIPAVKAETDQGNPSTITVTTPNIHDFKESTKLYLKNSRATRNFAFNLSDVVGSASTEFENNVGGFGGTGETDYYTTAKIIADDFVGEFEINIPPTDINTTNGEFTYNLGNQINAAANSSIENDDVLVYYTPLGNNPIDVPVIGGSIQDIQNFKPFRVSDVSSVGDQVTFKLKYNYDSLTSAIVPNSAGSNVYGNHRFIKANRITRITGPNIIQTAKPHGFVGGDIIIINYGEFTNGSNPNATNANTVSFGSTVGTQYIANYNGQTANNYYIYQVSSVPNTTTFSVVTAPTNNSALSVTPNFGNGSFYDLVTLRPNYIVSCAKITPHPLHNSIYLGESTVVSGFSTSAFEDYQQVFYGSNSSLVTLPGFTLNRSYLVKQSNISKPGWYRFYENFNNVNSSDTAEAWNTAKNLYFNAPGVSGGVDFVTNTGIHTVTSILPVDDANTVSIENRGGLTNDENVIYTSDLAPIGGLTQNEAYVIKTEDVSLSSDSFRLSEYKGSLQVYGFTYNRLSSTAVIQVYDTLDRISPSFTSEDGIVSIGITGGNTLQVSGCDYPNPIKKEFINNNFVIQSVSQNNNNFSTKFDNESPLNFKRFYYDVTVSIPTDGSFNRENNISINRNTTSGDVLLALQSTRVSTIVELDTTVAGNGENRLTQNIDGALDDIYRITNPSTNEFEIDTQVQIPTILKNISIGTGIAESAITLNSSSFFAITGNGTLNLDVRATAFDFTGGYVAVVGATGLTAPARVSFKINNTASTIMSAGLSESTSTSQAYTSGYQILQNQSTTSRSFYSQGSFLYSQSGISSDDVYEIEYTTDGYIKYYLNSAFITERLVGTGKTLYPVVSYNKYYLYNNTTNGIVSFKNASTGASFFSGQTYLNVNTHNYSDGTLVTYTASDTQVLDPLVNGNDYYVRVLDGNYIGLSSSFDNSIDRSSGNLIGITTSGGTGTVHTLETNSINGNLTGNGSVAITTTSDIVRGSGTNFLSDFSIGETFRTYRNGIGTVGEYFESKIVSIKSDSTIKLEQIPTFESTNASYFKQTGLFAVSDGKVTHRPFDGGVAMFTGLIPNSKVVRQTRKYFRYQSGKGIQVSMAINFNPTNDIDVISPVGTGSTTYYNIKSKFAHNLSDLSIDSSQKVIISGVEGSAESFFNRLSTDTGFTIKSVPDQFNFVIEVDTAPTSNEILGFPKYNLKNWGDCAIRAGLFDDQNGFFFEYDGQDLHAVRRSSTQQLSGRFQVQRNSHTIQGSNSILSAQLNKNDSIVIRGQTYKVVSILSDSALSVQPAYRGNSSNDIVISKVIDTKVPQSQWSLDKMDATGNSGYNIDISKIQMIYMDYSWYGAGSIRFGFKDQYGDVRYAHEFIHNNIFTESYFRSGNIPARYEVETFDNPLYSPALNHWGVSVIMDGRYDDDKAYLFTADSDALPFTNDGYSEGFNGTIVAGSNIISNIDTSTSLFDYSQLVIGESLLLGTSNTNTTETPGYLDPEAKIEAIEIDIATTRRGSRPTYKIRMSKPALQNLTLSTSATNRRIYAYSGTSRDLQNLVPLVSIRLAPSVDNGNIGNLGFRDIINRMQLTLKTAGVLTTHDCEVQLILNGKLSDDNYQAVTSPSLSQIYTHEVGDRISEGIKVYSFRAQGGQLIAGTAPIGRRGLSSTDVSLDELALLGNSILGGDGTFPDGPDVLTLAVRPIDTSTINGSSPFIISGKISWAEAQA